MYCPLITSSNKKVAIYPRIIKNSQHLVLQCQKWQISPYTHTQSQNTKKQRISLKTKKKNLLIGIFKFSSPLAWSKAMKYKVPTETDRSQIFIFAIVHYSCDSISMTFEPFNTALPLQIPYPYNLTTSSRTYISGCLVAEADSRYRFLPKKVKVKKKHEVTQKEQKESYRLCCNHELPVPLTHRSEHIITANKRKERTCSGRKVTLVSLYKCSYRVGGDTSKKKLMYHTKGFPCLCSFSWKIHQEPTMAR